MESMDRYLQADLNLELLDQLRELEAHVLAFESEASVDTVASLERSVQTLHEAAFSANELKLRNVEYLSHELANSTRQLVNATGALQTYRIGAVLTAIDTLDGLLENIDCSDEFDISGQLGLLRDCDAFRDVSSPAAESADRVQSSELGSGVQGIVRRFDVATGSSVKDQRSAQQSGCGAQRSQTVEPFPAAQNTAAELDFSCEDSLAQSQTIPPTAMPSRTQAKATVDCVPLSDSLFADFPRLAKELAAMMGKRCAVTLSGSIDSLNSELAVVLRWMMSRFIEDAVYCRIELPVERRVAGKPDAGQISVRVDQTGGALRVRVADDGKPIDVHELKLRAVECRFVSCEFAAEMTDHEVLQMALLSGITGPQSVAGTRSVCRRLCGVRAEIERLGGRVSLDSRCPFGTEIEIALPQAVLSQRVVSVVSQA